MPVEIRELVIKAYIEDAQGGGGGEAAAGAPNKEEIIADCMEQISQMLKDQQER